MENHSRRKILGKLAALSLLYPLVAFGSGNLVMKKRIITSDQKICVECMKKRAWQRSAFINKGPQ